jgi:hypothetical protein
MNFDSEFQQLLARFGAAFNLPDLTPDHAGHAAFAVGDEITVQLDLNQTTGVVNFCIVAGTIEEAIRSKVYPYLLQANLFVAGNNGVTFGASRDGDIVVSRQESVGQIDTERMQEIVHALVGVVEFIEEDISAIRRGTLDPLAPPSPTAHAPQPSDLRA